MKRIVFTASLVLLCVFTCLSQTAAPGSPETLKRLLQKSKPDTARIHLLLQISKAYIVPDNKPPQFLDSALLYAQQAATLAQTLKDNTWLGNSYVLMAKIFAVQERLPEGKATAQKAIDLFSKNGNDKKLAESYMALAENYETYDSGVIERARLSGMAADLFKKENDKENEAAALKGVGEMLMYEGKMEEGIEKLKQSLAIYRSIGYAQVQEVYSLIGASYSQIGNLQEGLNYGLQAVKTAEALKDTGKGTGLIYNYIAVTYEKLGQLENASGYLKKALTISERGDDVPFTVMLVTNIAHISLRLKKPEEAILYLKGLVKNYPTLSDRFALLQINTNFLEAYLQLKDYKNAGEYCAKLLVVAGKFAPDDPSLVIVYPNASEYYLQTKQFDKALKYLLLLKKIAEKNKMPSRLKTVHLQWFKLDSAQGHLASAIEHYKLYKAYNDSLFNETESKQIAQLQTQFNTEKKDKDILMLTRQSEFQKTELHQAALLRNLTFGGIALLIIIVALLYNRYLIKQRSNKRLEKKQIEINQKNISLQHLVDEKQWLLKEIHHRVKNNLQIVMSLLNSQSAFLQNGAALTAIQDSQHRVHAMSLIHQKLYSSENVSTINMPVYIRELVEYIRDCFKTGQRIRFEIAVDAVDLDVCQAVPIGLILNEAITNSIKYAFPDDRQGIISIMLSNTAAHDFLLTISDNGIGIPLNFTEGKPGSLGMSLIQGLTEDLEGSFTIENNNGTVLKISFLHDIVVKRMNSINTAVNN
jgi:two-component system, sensor histidine kinase PdtaS